jgi:phosphotransferase system HPr (HPr) family protein
MIFEVIAKAVATKLAGAAIEPTLNSLHDILVSERALTYAKEALRAKYEPLLAPASYDHVVDHLRITKDDFIGYHRLSIKDPHASIINYLSERLQTRSDEWIYNRPDTQAFSNLVNDFIEEYQTFFITTDPQLATLNLLGVSSEVLRVVSDIKDEILRNHAPIAHSNRGSDDRDVAKELSAFLTALNIPYTITYRGHGCADIVVTDPSSLFVHKVFLSFHDHIRTVRPVDDILERAVLQGRRIKISIVYFNSPPPSIINYIQEQGMICQSLAEFRETFLRIAPNERFVVGSLAVHALLSTYNVHEVYIEHDSVHIVPSGEYIADSFFDTREPVIRHIDNFIHDDNKILIILGGYGSGKSALCGVIASKYAENDKVTPVYFALRQLRTADDVYRIALRADQLAKTVAGGLTKSLLIFDGLDELPNAMTLDERRQNMLRLLQAASVVDKLVVTVRTSYFRGLDDLWNLFGRTGDDRLWNQMAQFIPQTGHRPGVTALVLREFNSVQMELYAQKFGEYKGYEPGFSENFFKEMSDNDPGFHYRILARNPLYLFLLINSRPWEGGKVGSFGDVIGLLVKYWLERDIEKGRSRWMLTVEDRTHFAEFVACKMFESAATTLSFSEFDTTVREFLGTVDSKTDVGSIILDLQTTGILFSSGGTMSFLVPGFLDYFVAQKFAQMDCSQDSNGKWSITPKMIKRLPNREQTRMWMGFVEVNGTTWSIEEARAALKLLGVDWRRKFYSQINVNPQAIIYLALDKKWNWPSLNNEENGLRTIINAAFANVEADDTGLGFRVENSRGLHARTAARICKVYEAWKGSRSERAEIWLRKRGDTTAVTAGSIMGIMMLAAVPGTTVNVIPHNCTHEDAEGFLRELKLAPERGNRNLWSGDLDKEWGIG